MTTIIAGMQNSVLVLESSKSGWKTYENLKGSHPQGIALDRLNPSRAYCGTFGDGLWKTDNSGVEKLGIVLERMESPFRI
jgi:hypothetical protein